jgi:hypothetical protein
MRAVGQRELAGSSWELAEGAGEGDEERGEQDEDSSTRSEFAGRGLRELTMLSSA